MRITKIKIRNMFGITEFESDGRSLEIKGTTGAGKTAVIDAIRFALTNNSNRAYIIKQGEDEASILVETDTGLSISRRERAGKAGLRTIRLNGADLQAPESFLKDIYSELQLSPTKFLAMDSKQQNAAILDLIKFDWDLKWIEEQFGEIVPLVNWEQNILGVLNDIQSEGGHYFQKRQNLNRDIRNKVAICEEIAAAIPPDYTAEKWENINLGTQYTEIAQKTAHNNEIQRAKDAIENQTNRLRKIEADGIIEQNALGMAHNANLTRIDADIAKYQQIIEGLKNEALTAKETYIAKIDAIKAKYEGLTDKEMANFEKMKELAQQEAEDLTQLTADVKFAEAMKAHINEYKRMKVILQEIEKHKEDAQKLTEKIEKARNLPAEVLKTCEIPVVGLTVVDGMPLINGLPISNLSDGEKLNLCVDVTLAKPNGLKLILIDGVEKLSLPLREQLYTKCKEKGVQFIATKTTDFGDFEVVEL
jgi:exonuclease SbcC